MDEKLLASLVAQHMALPYHRVVRGDAAGGFSAEVAELPGCMTGASSAREPFEMLDEAMALWLEVAIPDGDTIPGPARALTPVA